MTIVEELEHRWYFGEFDLDSVSDFASRALAAGHDGRALRELAWQQATWDDASALLNQVILEMGVGPLPNPAAGLRIARRLAGRIVAGEVEPYEGALRLNATWLSDPFPGQAAFQEVMERIENAHGDDEVGRLKRELVDLARSLLGGTLDFSP